MPTVDELSPANEQRRSLCRRQPEHSEPCPAGRYPGPLQQVPGQRAVRYFLVNARTWWAEVAKGVKAELKEML